jgi:hypothetical protein
LVGEWRVDRLQILIDLGDDAAAIAAGVVV